ncbi:MAG: class I SAM-dependent methyltransferase [Elusimicrobia bacterium]|nr:class I SAM-dependent methyltransferase [Elusimicrobiota bacterium]
MTYLRGAAPNEADRQTRTFRRFSASHNAFFAFIEERFGGSCPERVLELGCGTGEMAEAMRRRWDCAAEGWDASEEYLSAGRRAYPEVIFRRVPFGRRPLPKERFGLVIFREALMEHGRPADLLSWAARLLRKDGLIAALEPDYSGTMIYPEIPGWDEFLEKYRKYCLSKGEDFRAGRALLFNFLKAGLRGVQVRPVAETHTSLDSRKLRDFMEIEAFSVGEDLRLFGKDMGVSRKAAAALVKALREIPSIKGAYVQTAMMAACGRR